MFIDLKVWNKISEKNTRIFSKKLGMLKLDLSIYFQNNTELISKFLSYF